MNGIQIEMTKMLLPEQALDQAVRLMGFEYAREMFHVLAFDFGDDGGAIGIWKEGSAFCARISLDGLANFYRLATAGHIEGHA